MRGVPRGNPAECPIESASRRGRVAPFASKDLDRVSKTPFKEPKGLTVLICSQRPEKITDYDGPDQLSVEVAVDNKMWEL